MVAETATALVDAAVPIAAMGESVRAVREYDPWAWTDAAEWSVRARKFKERYGRRGAMPKRWGEVPSEFIAVLHPDIQRQCRELVRLGLERKAIRLAYCGKLGRIYVCPECGRPAKKIASCKNAMCLACAKKNFDALFRRFLEVDKLISASVRSLPGWTWNVLDFSFRHDGDFPTQSELRAMVQVIRRTVERAVREAAAELYRVRQGCRLRFDEDRTPMMSYDGWPIASAPDGAAKVLVGWTVVYFPEHVAPDNEARKHGTRGAKKTIPATWELRFGYELVRVREFGFDNVNAHFHCAYFGPRLDYWKNRDGGHLVCGGRLVEIFKEETYRALGEESYTVFYEKSRRGFRSVLSHALKYTEKIPASTPEKLAELEHVVQGTRRVALLGAHYGVPLKSKLRDPKCPACGSVMGRLNGVGLVPLAEIEDLPNVVDEFAVGDSDASAVDEDKFADEEVRAP